MATQTPPQPAPFALPPDLNPDTLDTLTELANLLTRLRSKQTSTGTGTSGGGGGGGGSTTTTGATPSQPASQSQSHSHPASQHHPQPHQSQNPNATANTSASYITPELSLKEIPTATDALKHRFQRARALVGALPDLGRGLDEQEAEMAMLEARLARQREVLVRLREVGARFAARDGDNGDGVVDTNMSD